MDGTLTTRVKAALHGLGVSPKKRFGQHFMISKAALECVAEALSPRAGETVIEIGPGLGFLTEVLLKRNARVIAVEKDRAMAAHLCRQFPSGLRVLEKDVLELDIAAVAEGSVKIAGNIPYNITSPILQWLIDQRRSVSGAALTVQWEVAERLLSVPGRKSWGPLSVFVQFYADVECVRKISRADFYPAPKVDSAVLKIVFLEKSRVPVADEKAFFAIVRRSFQKRRKTLLNSLEGWAIPHASDSLLSALEDAGLDPRCRGETLSLAEWAKLSDRLSIASDS